MDRIVAIAVWKNSELFDGALNACERGDVMPDFTDLVSVPNGGEVVIMGLTIIERERVQQYIQDMRNN